MSNARSKFPRNLRYSSFKTDSILIIRAQKLHKACVHSSVTVGQGRESFS